MIEAFLRTFREVFTPFFWGIIIINLIITGLFFWGLIWISGELIKYLLDSFNWFDWISNALGWLADAGAIFLSYLMLPIIFPIISYIFQDFITAHLNKKYNKEGQNISIPIMLIVSFALKFALLSVFLNLLFLPFYLIPVVGAVIYFCLNSYLLGREYYQLAAYTLLEKEKIVTFRKENSSSIFICGVVISLFFLTPFVNLVAPIIGIIFAWFYVLKLSRKTKEV